ncbi:MAG: DUF1499 domain-containing protein [Proteobacteria bacterium]|nr:DUF1499 domain-containing protein [Pseudomonadota bacterium]MBU1138776.1 DUF1499 domain-containing protein [Pseudomonadota bacterium]MBU1232027.1 DUF1499 domain-containing protein [Pseudomonadota bacterium]MBU1418059.1 DUF1499 domain-containing protein [Pseudomonadota bacterium]MBU1454095.1 DUF1499 domain-containing protein [Pseudomonadota bacterium]
MKTLLRITLFLALLAAPLVAGCSDNNQEVNLEMTPSQQNNGVDSEHLSPCPARPNCVSSEAPPGPDHIAPLRFSGAASAAWQALQNILVDMGGQVEKVDDHFLHVTFRSRIFRFVDDLTCRLDRTNNLIQIRSAARVGYSDFGVNRKRVERLRLTFDERVQNSSDNSPTQGLQ